MRSLITPFDVTKGATLSNLPFLTAGFPLHQTLKAVPQQIGVYAIHNQVNDFVYIGSTSQGFRTRLIQHVRCLRRSSHHSYLLQRDVDYFGFPVFNFYILETCLPDQCFELEQLWLDLRGVGISNRSYNISPTADTFFGAAEFNSLEFVVTSPTGQEIPIKNLTKFCRENSLFPSHMINVAKAVYDQHKGWRCRYANESQEDHQLKLNRLRRNREYIVTTPDGSELIIKNLKQFCREIGFGYAAMLAILKAKHLQSHAGWRCRLANEPEAIRLKRLALQGKNKRYIVTFPNGHEETLEGLPAFCKEHGLCCSSMTKVALGKHFQHKGFKLRYAEDSIDERNERLKHRKNNREYIVTDPDGNEFLTNSLKSFAQEHNVSHSALSKLVYGETLDGKTGWQCRLAWETEVERRARVSAKLSAKRLKHV